MRKLLHVGSPLQAWKERVIDMEVQAVPAVAMEELLTVNWSAVAEEQLGSVVLLEVERLAVPLFEAVVDWVYDFTNIITGQFSFVFFWI
jgi:hypothetical protein